MNIILITSMILVLTLIPRTSIFAQTPASPVRFILEVRDVVLGERGVGAVYSFNLVIENNNENDILLATGPAHSWMVHSPFWKLQLEGPVSDGCHPQSEPTATWIGKYPYIKIPARSKESFVLDLRGAGNIGDYSVRVEYDGQSAPDGLSRLVIRSQEAKFRINEPTGIDAEITSRWRVQNPDKPWCAFPSGMEPNIVNPFILLEMYPTSTYALWAFADIHNLLGRERVLNQGQMRRYLNHLLSEGNDLGKPVIKVDREGKDIKDQSGQFLTITEKERLATSIHTAEKICGNHSDHSLCETIRYSVVAAYYLKLLQFDVAKSIYSELGKNAKSAVIRENARTIEELMNSLQDHSKK